jgi:hypothetical protein
VPFIIQGIVLPLIIVLARTGAALSTRFTRPILEHQLPLMAGDSTPPIPNTAPLRARIKARHAAAAPHRLAPAWVEPIREQMIGSGTPSASRTTRICPDGAQRSHGHSATRAALLGTPSHRLEHGFFDTPFSGRPLCLGQLPCNRRKLPFFGGNNLRSVGNGKD